MAVATGIVAFSNVETEDQYKGKPSGFNITLTMDAAESSKLVDQGIVVKDYEGTPQRKFRSKYPPVVVDADDNEVAGEIPYGSVVRVQYNTGPKHPEHGVPSYLNRVRIVTLAEHSAEADEEF